MSERKRRPRVTLCAAVTFDGKLDTRNPLPSVLLDALVSADGDRLVADTAVAVNVSIIASTARGKPANAVRALKDDPHVKRILCLGGPRLFRALLDAGLVEDFCLLVRPHVDGRRAAATLSGPPTPEWFPHSISCRLRRMEVRGDDCFLHYTVARRTTCNPS